MGDQAETVSTATDSNVPSLPLAAMERLLNDSITASTAARKLCRQLDAKTLLIDVTGTPLRLTVLVEGERLRLGSDQGQAADVRLRATPVTLLRLGVTDPRELADALELEGDAELAAGFQRLLGYARPDWEEELSHWIGDVGAHQLGNLARSAMGWAANTVETLTRNGGEFLQEEARELPTRIEVDNFVRAVDKLRDDVERASARLEQVLRTPRS